MDSLIERYSTLLLDSAKIIGEDKSIPVIERIIRVVMSLNISDGSGIEITKHIHKPQNALMHHKIQKVIIGGVPHILEGIIREGIDQGLFHTPYPYECMEMVVAYTNTVFDNDDIVELTDEERISRIQALIFNIERLLNVESGSLLCMMQIFDKDNGGSDELPYNPK